jgi:hypothetical protein
MYLAEFIELFLEGSQFIGPFLAKLGHRFKQPAAMRIAFGDARSLNAQDGMSEKAAGPA